MCGLATAPDDSGRHMDGLEPAETGGAPAEAGVIKSRLGQVLTELDLSVAWGPRADHRHGAVSLPAYSNAAPTARP